MKYRHRILSEAPLKGYRPMPETTPWAESYEDIGYNWRKVARQQFEDFMKWEFAGDINSRMLDGLSVCTGPCSGGYILYARVYR